MRGRGEEMAAVREAMLLVPGTIDRMRVVLPLVSLKTQNKHDYCVTVSN